MAKRNPIASWLTSYRLASRGSEVVRASFLTISAGINTSAANLVRGPLVLPLIARGLALQTAGVVDEVLVGVMEDEMTQLVSDREPLPDWAELDYERML